MKIKKLNLKHETKLHSLKKYIIVLAIIISYFVITSLKIGLKEGLSITVLTWSFFVFCTPIADAGFLLDFPIRIITKLRMVYSEMIVWAVAIVVNICYLIFNPNIYNYSLFLSLFKHILLQPIPYWIVIVLSAVGTFLSITFFDELLDIKEHKERKLFHKHSLKYELIVLIFIIIIIIILYFYLIKTLNLNIPIL